MSTEAGTNGNGKTAALARQEEIAAAGESIQRAVSECGVMAIQKEAPFMQAIRMSFGVGLIRKALTDDFVSRYFMPLQGTALGFLTDLDTKGGYDVKVVKDVLCEALLRGFRPVGNEFNIISGRFYGAKAGFERIVQEWPGLSGLQIDMGVPHLAGEKGALVACRARWFLDGEEMKLECVAGASASDVDTRIPVKVNAGMGPDAILGKATRKLYARIYQRLSGCSRDVVDTEPEVIPAESLPAPAAPAQDGKRMKMGGSKATDPASDADGHPEPGAAG